MSNEATVDYIVKLVSCCPTTMKNNIFKVPKIQSEINWLRIFHHIIVSVIVFVFYNVHVNYFITDGYHTKPIVRPPNFTCRKYIATYIMNKLITKQNSNYTLVCSEKR